jgi:hypothetical protein
LIHTRIILNSKNTKTGPVRLATYRTQGSCPTDCSLYGAGCYAENRGANGRPSLFQVAVMKDDIVGTDYGRLRDALRALGPGSIIRLNVSGDYLLEDETPDMAYIEATNDARRLLVLSYTHAWRRLDPAWFHDETRPNASCDSVEDVRDALAAGWKAVIVDPDGRYPQGSKIEGATCVTCPYEVNKRQCVDCQLCTRFKRPSIVVFPVHGSRRRIAARALGATS